MAYDKLVDSTQLDTDLTLVANAIRTKGGTTAQLSFPSGMVTAIGNISTGASSVDPVLHGVNFVDYDGTVIETWQTLDVSGKTALPSNPTHDGLTSQGWNWTLAEIKSYLTDYPEGVVWVGQLYVPTDGKTRIYIHLEDGRLSPYLVLYLNGSVDVDWGDGTAHDTLTGSSTATAVTKQHTYANAGDYVIKLSVTGTAVIHGTSSYLSRLISKNTTDNTGLSNVVYTNSVRRVEIGNGVEIDWNAFQHCHNLTEITFPSTSTVKVSVAFQYCTALRHITLPRGVTTIDSNAFNYCYSLESISLPPGLTTINGGAFYFCTALRSITIPSTVTTMSGNSTIRDCYRLVDVTNPSSLTAIGAHQYRNDYGLAGFTVRSTVTSIGSGAFYGCYGLKTLKFMPSTPPTVADSIVFTGIPTDCIIYVPTGSLSAYTSATNYPSSSVYSYVEY